MRNPNELIKHYREEIIHDIEQSPAFKSGKAELILTPTDYTHEATAKQTVLEELVRSGLIKSFTISEKEIRPQPATFTDLEAEQYPEEVYLTKQEYSDELTEPRDCWVADIIVIPNKFIKRITKEAQNQIIIRGITYKDGVFTVNNEKNISIKPRRGGLEGNKALKILSQLFSKASYRETNLKRPKAEPKTDPITPTTLKELMDISKAVSVEAVVQSIKRLNEKFRTERLPLFIHQSVKRKDAYLIIETVC